MKRKLEKYVSEKQKEAWDEMGDTGSCDYEVNKENFWYGYFRALEDLEREFDLEIDD